jgi:hypothetical protein
MARKADSLKVESFDFERNAEIPGADPLSEWSPTAGNADSLKVG